MRYRGWGTSNKAGSVGLSVTSSAPAQIAHGEGGLPKWHLPGILDEEIGVPMDGDTRRDEGRGLELGQGSLGWTLAARRAGCQGLA